MHTRTWLILAAISTIWTLIAIALGESPLAPMLVSAVFAACGANAKAGNRVLGVAVSAMSGSALRSLIVVSGAMLLIQLLPLEMALLLAGDVLAYVEIVAATAFVTANTRLRPIIAAGLAGVSHRLAPVRRVIARVRTAARAVATRPTPPSDEDAARPLIFA